MKYKNSWYDRMLLIYAWDYGQFIELDINTVNRRSEKWYIENEGHDLKVIHMGYTALFSFCGNADFTNEIECIKDLIYEYTLIGTLCKYRLVVCDGEEWLRPIASEHCEIWSLSRW